MNKIIKALFLASFGLFCFVAGVTYQLNTAEPKVVERTTYRPYSQEMLWTHIQNYKSESGSQPYIQDQNLCKFADIRLPQLHKEFSHRPFDNGMSDQIFAATKFNKSGENLVTFGFYNTDPIEKNQLNEWLRSPKHKENLDDPMFTHSCLRCDQSYCVQIFAGY